MAKKKIPQTIEIDDLMRILSFFIREGRKTKNQYKKFVSYRNSTIVFLCYFMGLRPKECKNIRFEDIDFNKQTLFIPAMNNKQRNADVLPIPDFCFNFLMKYLEKRKEFFKEKDWIFPAKDHRTGKVKEMDRGTLCRDFKRVLKKLNLYRVSYVDKRGRRIGNLSLYSLRHSFATNCYSKTRDIRKTALLLRHYDFLCRSCMVYIHTTQGKKREDVFREIYGSKQVIKI